METEIKTGVKLVRPSRNKLMSLFRRSEVEYAIGSWTYPRKSCGPLCVFDNLEDALAFSRSAIPNPHMFYACEFVKSSETRAYGRIGTFCELSVLPEGTVLASKVRLTKLIIIKRKEERSCIKCSF